MTLFHEIVQAREPRRRGDAPPRVRDAQPSDSLAGLFEGTPRKWWAAEVRFDRVLTRREVRCLERAYAPWASPSCGYIGADGMVWSQWWNKWPGREDAAELVRAMQRVGVPGVVRAAPFGRDCVGAWSCPSGLGDGERCGLGWAWSCSPVFTRADWIAVWPEGWRPS